MTVATDTPTTVSVTIGGSEISFETGRLARQASGAVVVRSGETMVLATATGSTSAREGTDFFPLTVDVEEKSYAAGKIPGGFFKREGRSGEKAILTARMIDRPIRPLWPKNFHNDVHCIATVMSADMVHNHDILAINGISAALMISPLPFMGPIGAVRVGLVEGELRVNPTMPEMVESDLDLIVCGTEEAITMVEAGANVVPEDTLVEALELAHTAIKDLCAVQYELRAAAGKPKWTDADTLADFRTRYMDRIEALIGEHGVTGAREQVFSTLVDDAAPTISLASGEDDINQRIRANLTLSVLFNEARVSVIRKAVQDQFGAQLREFSDHEQDSKELKAAKKSLLLEQVVSGIKLPFPTSADGTGFDALTTTTVKAAFDAAYKALVRTKIAVEKRRPDGRSERELRAISVEIDVSPCTHGAGLFTRGQTQVMSLATLGTTREEQRIDDLSLDTNRYYMHHYNFPPFSVGETGFMRGPKRRDIGHGALAERALVPVLPPLDAFPYTVRVVSETLESNGSSSMASVCGSTLALMDAGVPIKAPVAGIAMGLIMEGDEYVILTDIQGAEDHLGDMDFKVAGTDEGITALQMDIKITGVTTELLRNALAQAKEARLAILDKMLAVIADPRPEVKENAPAFAIIKVDPDQIGMVIGKGGETIRSLEEEFSCQVGIQEDGTIMVYGKNRAATAGCGEAIDSMTREIAVGDEFDGTVVKTTDFGAFVNLRRGTDGLLHISAIGPGRIEKVEDVLNIGDEIGVRVQEVDPARGRIGLVLIRDKDGNVIEPREPSKPSGGRGGDRGPRSGGDRGPRGGGDRGPRGGGNRGGGDRGPRSGGNRSGGGERSGGSEGGSHSRHRRRSAGGNREGGTGGDSGSEGSSRPSGQRGSSGNRSRSGGNGGNNSGGGNRSGSGNRSGGQNRSGGSTDGGRNSGGQGNRSGNRSQNDRPSSAPTPAPTQTQAPGGFMSRLKNKLGGSDS